MTRRTAAAAKPTAKKATAKKATAKKAAAKPAPEKLSTDSKVIPTDPTELRQLIKITRDRRWRAGRRGDDDLVAEMTVRLEKLTAKLAKLEKAAATAAKKAAK